jgi:predicted secreted Zn-dependent protease
MHPTPATRPLTHGPARACLLLLVCLPVHADLSEHLRFKTYTAPHAPGTTLLSALDAASPIRTGRRTFHGFAAWNIEWRYTWEPLDGGYCRIRNLQTVLTTEITLPHLVTASVDEQGRFSGYLNALREHELGHHSIARAAAARIDAAVGALAPQPSCDRLETAVNAIGHREVESARAEEIEYDRSTQYGRTQGAWLPR